MPQYKVTERWTRLRRLAEYQATKQFEASNRDEAEALAIDELFNVQQSGADIETLGWTVNEQDLVSDVSSWYDEPRGMQVTKVK